MKILTIIGTRPEIIRLSLIIKKLDNLTEHILVYTNQNYDKNLSTIFFEDLNIRKPDYYFQNEAKSVGEFLSYGYLEFEKILLKEKPEKILTLGDTNSGLLVILAKKFNIPIYHMEAGNRCYDDKVPEETNRKIIDSISTYNLPYTENSKQNLLKDGYDKNHVFKIGNPLYEVVSNYKNQIKSSKILNKLNLSYNEYVLVTAHRSENVDNEISLKQIFDFINEISSLYKVVFSLHPRTKDKLNKLNLIFNDNVIISEPFGFFDFINLEMNSKCIISDSGSVPEESQMLKKQCIIIRESTERQELIENGSCIMTGVNSELVLHAFKHIITLNTNWINIPEYIDNNVSDKVIRILLSKK